MPHIHEPVVVTRLDDPEDARSTGLPNPSWSEIETAIRKLDGETCAPVCRGITEPPASHITIATGPGRNEL